MNLSLHLTPEAEAKLVEKARLAGRSPEQVALEILEDGLALESESDEVLPLGDRIAQFRAWVAMKHNANPDADISRA